MAEVPNTAAQQEKLSNLLSRTWIPHSLFQRLVQLLEIAVDGWCFRDTDKLSAQNAKEAANTLVVFSGTCAKPSILIPLLIYAQQKYMFDVVAFPNRMPIDPRKLEEVTQWGDEQVKELKKRGKNVATFGYSMGGVIAHAVGEATGSPSLSLYTSAYGGASIAGKCLEWLRGCPLPTVTIPEKGRAIVPEHSLLVHEQDFPANSDRVFTARGVDTHLGINHMETRKLVRDLLGIIFKELNE